VKIIANQKFLFIKDDKYELEQKPGQTFIVSPSPREQVAPDWIAETGLYKVAVEAGAIVAVEPPPAPEPLRPIAEVLPGVPL
jgi:hypothetical protein